MMRIAKKKWYILSFVVPLLIYIIFLSLKQVIPDVESFFATDLRAQHLPILNYLKGVMLGRNSIYYSYFAGMGSSMVSTLVYYAVSPLNILLVVIKDVQCAVLSIYVLKVCLSGLCMFIFLKNKFKKESFVTVVFSTCYAVSAYVVNYFFCIFWFDSVYLAPLVLLGIDKILDKEKINLIYIFSLSLAIICNIQMGFGLCIFSVVYYLYSFNIKYDMKKDFKKFIQLSKIFLISSLCAGAISSGFILVLLSDFKTTIMAREIGYKNYSNTSSIDYIIKNFFAIGKTESNYNNDFEPYLYCGFVVTLLSILYLFDKNVDKKRRKSALLVILFFFISFCFKGLNVFWHLVDPIHLNYRYSVYLCLFLIVIAYDYYLSKDKFTKRDIMVLSISILVGLFFDLIYRSRIVIVYTIVFLLLSGILLFLVKNVYKRFEIVFLMVILVELTFNAYLSFYSNEDLPFNRYTSYAGLKELSSLNELEQDFRISYDYSYAEYTNDAFLLNKHSSLRFFYSTVSGNILSFVDRINSSYWKNYYTINSFNSPLVMSLLGNKYFYLLYDVDSGVYKKVDTYKIKTYNYRKKKTKSNTVYFYENPYSLSLGYVINKDVKYNKKDSFVDYQNKLIKNFSGNDKNVIEKVDFTEDKDGDGCDDAGEFECKAFSITNKTNNDYVYVYSIVKDFRADNKIDAYISSDFPYLLHSNKKNYKLAVIYSADYGIKKDLFVTYNKENLIESLKMLQENMITDVKVDKNVMKAKIDSSKDGILFLSIPYDKRFNIYVDGKKIKYYPLLDNTFIGLDIKKGQHRIKLVNRDNNLKWYVLSSLISLIITIVIYLYQDKIIKYKQVSR